jgi:hypothetical protein
MVRLVDNAGTAEFRDQKDQRLILNTYNKTIKKLGKDHPYTTDTTEVAPTSFRRWMNNADWLIEFLVDGANFIDITINGPLGRLGAYPWIGVVLDAESGIMGDCAHQTAYYWNSAATRWVANPKEGYHYLYPVLASDGRTDLVYYHYSTEHRSTLDGTWWG